MKKRVLLAILASLSICTGQLLAESILGVNFCSDDINSQVAGKTSDGFSNWTDSYPTGGNTGTNLVLLGSNNTVTCDWNAPGNWKAGVNSIPDEQIYYVYLDDGGNHVSVSFSGLSAWMAQENIGSYTVRIYQSTDNGNGFTPIDVRSGLGEEGTILTTVQETNQWTTDGGVRAYVDTEPLSDDVITIVTHPFADWYRATLCAVKITGVDPYIPINPTPENSMEVPVDQILSWEQDSVVSGTGVTYEVFLGTDPNELSPTYYGLNPIATTDDNPANFFYDPPVDLATDTIYYWKVDAITSTSERHEGAEWTFVTQPPVVRIDQDPEGVTVPVGASEVTLTVSGINITTYQWYKDGVPLMGDSTGQLYSGEKTATLTIYDVQLDDEGAYHCICNNSANQPDVSEFASVLTERLVGWWKLDGDLTDSVNDIYPDAAGHDGVSVDPNFIESGFDNGALEFFGDYDGLVIFPASAEFYNFYPRGYTISLWVNMTGAHNGWSSLVSKEGVYDEGATRNGFIVSNTDSGEAVHTLRQSFNDLMAGKEVDDEQWHQITVTYDGTSYRGTIYVDGVLANETTNSSPLTTNDTDLIFGAQNADPISSPYTGLLDDVRIWSYPLNAVKVASLYTDFNPDVEICIGNPSFDVSGPDGESDCKVDLYDFISFVDQWMECNLVPTCQQ